MSTPFCERHQRGCNALDLHTHTKQTATVGYSQSVWHCTASCPYKPNVAITGRYTKPTTPGVPGTYGAVEPGRLYPPQVCSFHGTDCMATEVHHHKHSPTIWTCNAACGACDANRDNKPVEDFNAIIGSTASRREAPKHAIIQKEPTTVQQETGWLLEANHTFKDGNAPHWWTGNAWSADSLDAIRFARKDDAAAFMRHQLDVMRGLSPGVIISVTEHQWTSTSFDKPVRMEQEPRHGMTYYDKPADVVHHQSVLEPTDELTRVVQPVEVFREMGLTSEKLESYHDEAVAKQHSAGATGAKPDDAPAPEELSGDWYGTYCNSLLCVIAGAELPTVPKYGDRNMALEIARLLGALDGRYVIVSGILPDGEGYRDRVEQRIKEWVTSTSEAIKTNV